jgi:hypothetical protein
VAPQFFLKSSQLIAELNTTSHPSGTFTVHPHLLPSHLPLPNSQHSVHRHFSSLLFSTGTECPSHIPQVSCGGCWVVKGFKSFHGTLAVSLVPVTKATSLSPVITSRMTSSASNLLRQACSTSSFWG